MSHVARQARAHPYGRTPRSHARPHRGPSGPGFRVIHATSESRLTQMSEIGGFSAPEEWHPVPPSVISGSERT
ncbi:hypothetical protein STTU_4785 [Streptomyces sp. Tu6071]|nr:hypothetical protein STTU_4785 [Streptomyces sp. Tu6071]